MIAGAKQLWSNKFVRKMVKKRLSYKTRHLLPI